MESPIDPRPDTAGLSLLVSGSYNPRIHRSSIWCKFKECGSRRERQAVREAFNSPRPLPLTLLLHVKH